MWRHRFGQQHGQPVWINLLPVWVCWGGIALASGLSGCSQGASSLTKWFKPHSHVEDPFSATEEEETLVAETTRSKKELAVSSKDGDADVKTADKKTRSESTSTKTVSKKSAADIKDPFEASQVSDAKLRAELEKKDEERKSRAVAEARLKAQAKARLTTDNSWDRLKAGNSPVLGNSRATVEEDAAPVLPPVRKGSGLPDGRVATSRSSSGADHAVEEELPRRRDRVVGTSGEETRKKVRSLLVKARDCQDDGRFDEALELAETAADLTQREGVIVRSNEERPEDVIRDIRSSVRSVSRGSDKNIVRQPTYRSDAGPTVRVPTQSRSSSSSSDRLKSDPASSRSTNWRTAEDLDRRFDDFSDAPSADRPAYPQDIRDIRDRRRTAVEPPAKTTDVATRSFEGNEVPEPPESAPLTQELRHVAGHLKLASIEEVDSNAPPKTLKSTALTAGESLSFAPPPPTFVSTQPKPTREPSGAAPRDYRWLGLGAAVVGLFLAFRRRKSLS